MSVRPRKSSSDKDAPGVSPHRSSSLDSTLADALVDPTDGVYPSVDAPTNSLSPTSSESGHNNRFATAKHLIALGVGSVISGDYFGWQNALIGGILGLILAVIPTVIMYVLLCLSISELSTMLPTTGGPYVFALHAFGRRAAYFAGLAEALKVVVTCAVVNLK